jgi:uncharacterized protein YfkK (UPF0435 family)
MRTFANSAVIKSITAKAQRTVESLRDIYNIIHRKLY